jgi:hypothetical protein
MAKDNKLWRAAPAREDFVAARNYLSLLCPDTVARRLAANLSRARTHSATAKDLLRASGLPLLPRDELHVAADLKRIHKGKPLSPVLLVRGDLSHGNALVIADGYHRICAICYFDEDAPIACRITAMPH